MCGYAIAAACPRRLWTGGPGGARFASILGAVPVASYANAGASLGASRKVGFGGIRCDETAAPLAGRGAGDLSRSMAREASSHRGSPVSLGARDQWVQDGPEQWRSPESTRTVRAIQHDSQPHNQHTGPLLSNTANPSNSEPSSAWKVSWSSVVRSASCSKRAAHLAHQIGPPPCPCLARQTTEVSKRPQRQTLGVSS